MSTITYAEFCAGAGGLGMAVEDVFNASLSWYSEFEDAPSAVMAHHWPDAPNHGDMTRIDFTRVEPVDILSGGTPCQDVSLAGRRAGMREGTRSGIWESMREAIAIIQPRYVVWENVRGAYSAGADSDVEQCPGCMGEARDGEHLLRALGRVLGDLSDLGYDTQWRGLRAADVGAPHGRFRVFVLATRREVADSDNSGRGEQRRAFAVSPEHATIEHAGADASNSGGEVGDIRTGLREGQPNGVRWGRSDDSGVTAPNAAGIRPSNNIERGGRGVPAPTGTSGTGGLEDAAHPPGDAGRIQHRDHGTTDWGAYTPAIHRWEEVLGRAAPTPTELTAKGKHRLNARFAEWMMGWPAGWVNLPGISRNDQLKIIGNGVVPQQAVTALLHMLGADSLGVAA